MSATERLWVACLLVVIVGASAAATAVIYRPDQRRSPATSRPATAWDRWQALSESQRFTYIERYRAIARRPDAKEILRRAGGFGRLSAGEQERLRLLHSVLEEVLVQLPASQRAVLLDLHEHARAEAIYRILGSTSPERVTELRQRLTGEP